MRVKVKLPKLAETTDVLVIDEILVAVGDRVEETQPLMAVETDKVTVEVPSPVAGTVEEIVVTVGSEVRTGDVVCVLST